jgi:ubiquinone/menaquinone biosynthesis C-methylase UbiE
MTSWWNKNIENRLSDFESWVGSFDKPSKEMIRKHVIEKKHKSILDCGCGLASEYHGYKKDKYKIKYVGFDSCKKFIEINKSKNIEMIEGDLGQPMSLEDNSFDCVFSKDVLEHLNDYKQTLSEMIRIAKKEVIIGWFITPTNSDTKINYWEEEDLYHNEYNLEDLEKFILSHEKVDTITWESVDNKESNLYILLK